MLIDQIDENQSTILSELKESRFSSKIYSKIHNFKNILHQRTNSHLQERADSQFSIPTKSNQLPSTEATERKSVLSSNYNYKYGNRLLQNKYDQDISIDNNTSSTSFVMGLFKDRDRPTKILTEVQGFEPMPIPSEGNLVLDSSRSKQSQWKVKQQQIQGKINNLLKEIDNKLGNNQKINYMKFQDNNKTNDSNCLQFNKQQDKENSKPDIQVNYDYLKHNENAFDKWCEEHKKKNQQLSKYLPRNNFKNQTKRIKNKILNNKTNITDMPPQQKNSKDKNSFYLENNQTFNNFCQNPNEKYDIKSPFYSRPVSLTKCQNILQFYQNQNENIVNKQEKKLEKVEQDDDEIKQLLNGSQFEETTTITADNQIFELSSESKMNSDSQKKKIIISSKLQDFMKSKDIRENNFNSLLLNKQSQGGQNNKFRSIASYFGQNNCIQ